MPHMATKHKRPRSESRDLPKDFRTEAATWRISTLHLRKFNPSHFCDRVLSSRNPRFQRVVSSICTFLLDCTKTISWVSFAPLGVRFCHSLHGLVYDRTATNQGSKKKGRVSFRQANPSNIVEETRLESMNLLPKSAV